MYFMRLCSTGLRGRKFRFFFVIAFQYVVFVVIQFWCFNHLKMKRRPLYLKPSPYRAVNTFNLVYKNQPVYAVSGQVAVCSQINTKHTNAV
jgi:hypothetical protein